MIPQVFRRMTLHTLVWVLLVGVFATFVFYTCQKPAQQLNFQSDKKSAEQTGAQQFHFRPCTLDAPGYSFRASAKCVRVRVPQDWKSPTGKKIELHVALVEAATEKPAQDPLFVFAGGPGQASSQTYVQFAPGFGKILRKRDIVLVDQRGTGKSTPLDCDEGKGKKSGNNEWESVTDIEQGLMELKACATKLGNRPLFHTTGDYLKDIDFVRQQMGYQKINLYGISYGTRVAMKYLQHYEKHVRSVILDGVVAPDEPMGLRVPEDADAALAQVFLRCKQDKGCDLKFGDLKQSFVKLLEQVKKNPPVLETRHPRTGKIIKQTFNELALVRTVRFLNYSNETTAYLPLLIHQAAKGNLVPLATQGLWVMENLDDLIGEGLNLSVACAEDWSFLPKAGNQARAQQSYYENKDKEIMDRVCPIWPHAKVADNFHVPMMSKIPVLILSGGADPVTPPRNGARARKTLTNARHIIVEGMGHGMLAYGCISTLAAEFVSEPVVEFDAACAKKIKPMPLFLDFAGPTP